MDWELCKDDIRENLLSIAQVDKIIIALLGMFAVLRSLENNLMESLIIDVMVLIVSSLISIGITILVHLIFPKKKSNRNQPNQSKPSVNTKRKPKSR